MSSDRADLKIEIGSLFVYSPSSDLVAEIASTVCLGIVCVILCFTYIRIIRVMRRRLDAVKNTVPKAFNEQCVSYDFADYAGSGSESDSIDEEWEFFNDADDFNPFTHKITREVHYYRKRRVRLNDLRACGLLPPRPDPYFCDDDIDLSVYEDIDVTNVPTDFDRHDAMERAFANVPNRVMYKLQEPWELNPQTKEQGEAVELPLSTKKKNKNKAKK
ncbi:hypothetical protein L596_015379 [Steinernema carpocapsae]|uniref:Uncharacterized protein n=1 Tax=Steinernema carpocapsae TaxID=34508 RepID=A0A4U5NG34_STECR|nr:hypothetical protein L596_015379 [Steinernema carpocapsae]